MKTKGVIEHRQSGGNVFADVGLPEGDLAKAEIVAKIDDRISSTGMTQIKAAEWR